MTYTSQRGRIEPPNLDDRTWQDLSDEMKRLIPRYAPQWTDHNPSDIGITLIELFAWLGESMIYRLNQTPMKNYVAFLNLLGIVRNPATPAKTYLTFTTETDRLTISAGTQAQTPVSAGQPPVVFETDEDVTLRKTNLKAALVLGPFATGAAASTYRDQTSALVGPPTARTPVAVPVGQSVQLCWGFDQSVTGELQLGVLLSVSAPTGTVLVWSASADGTEPLGWPTLAPDRDTTAALTRDGVVRLTTPGANWAPQRATAPATPAAATGWASVTADVGTQPVTDSLFWLGMTIVNPGTVPLTVEFDRLLFNATAAHSAVTNRAPEHLGRSSGAPFQVFALANRPLFRGTGIETAYDHLVVEVGSGTPTTWEEWKRVEDLPPGGDHSYRLNAITGEIMFGNFDDRFPDGHGQIPPSGHEVRARSYRYVAAGAAGNVAPQRVTIAGTGPDGAKITVVVSNNGSGFDGVDEEPVEDTLRRAPEELKVRNRAVTAEDYEFLAGQLSFAHTSRCLTSMRHDSDGPAGPGGTLVWKANDPWNYAGICRGPGFVTMVIVPDSSVARPEPTEEQIVLATTFFEQRRDLTTHLKVVGPRYLPVSVTAEIRIWQNAIDAGISFTDVEQDALRAIRAFLHPTRGGPVGRGWAVGQPVLSSDLFAAIAPPADIGYVSALSLSAETPSYHFPPLNPPGTSTNWKDWERPLGLRRTVATVAVADYELVCCAADEAHTIDSKAAQ